MSTEVAVLGDRVVPLMEVLSIRAKEFLALVHKELLPFGDPEHYRPLRPIYKHLTSVCVDAHSSYWNPQTYLLAITALDALAEAETNGHLERFLRFFWSGLSEILQVLVSDSSEDKSAGLGMLTALIEDCIEDHQVAGQELHLRIEAQVAFVRMRVAEAEFLHEQARQRTDAKRENTLREFRLSKLKMMERTAPSSKPIKL